MQQRILQQLTLPVIRLLALFCLLQFGAMGQATEMLIGLKGRPVQNSTSVRKAKTSAKTISLPIRDDFSLAQATPDTNVWIGGGVYINNHFGIDPINKGVATFDGLNSNGRPYNLNKVGTDTADTLTSHQIDLSNTVDSVILSFYYQQGGLGELPGVDDKLRLEFLNVSTQKWEKAWEVFGSATINHFSLVQIPITSPDYLQNGFQFRFMNQGSVNGAFDLWHLDRLEMRDNRGLKDSIFDNDPSIISQAPSLLKDYEAMPWFHYDSTTAIIQNDSVFRLRYRPNVRKLTNIGSINLGYIEIRFGANLELLNSAQSAVLKYNHNDTLPLTYPVLVNAPKEFILDAYPNNEFELTALHKLTGFNSNQILDSLNNFVTRKQVFRNYYAYDDGTAERAYTVTDNQGGFIVSKLDLATFTGDSLRGLYLYFSPADYDVTKNSFTIVVFENNAGLPGNLIYESDSIYTPVYSDNNFYLPYVLDSSIFILDNAFIGIRQQNNVPLTLGFDRNNIGRTTTFYGVESDFYQSFQSGTVMMRPFFRYIPLDIGLNEIKLPTVNFDVFPNPNNGRFSVELANAMENDRFEYSIYSLSGQLIQHAVLDKNTDIDVGNAIPGVYILKMHSVNGKSKTGYRKIIITD